MIETTEPAPCNRHGNSVRMRPRILDDAHDHRCWNTEAEPMWEGGSRTHSWAYERRYNRLIGGDRKRMWPRRQRTSWGHKGKNLYLPRKRRLRKGA